MKSFLHHEVNTESLNSITQYQFHRSRKVGGMFKLTFPLITPVSFPILSLHFIVIALLPSPVVMVIFLLLAQVSQIFPPLASQAHEIYICIGVFPAASVGQVIVSVTAVVLVVAGKIKFHHVGGVWSQTTSPLPPPPPVLTALPPS